jgi:penicillin amidase
VVLLAVACDGETRTDAGTDAGMDAGPTSTPIQLDGLDGEVEVIIDERGMPHIYASTEHDLLVVQGYLMARDRFIQMEFIRRGVTGRVAELLAAAGPDPGLIQDDMSAASASGARQQIYDSLASTIRRGHGRAFVDSINQASTTPSRAGLSAAVGSGFSSS